MLKDKLSNGSQGNALVVGGTSPIGMEVVRFLVESGMQVIFTGRSKTRCERFIKAIGHSARFHQLRIGDEAETLTLRRLIAKDFKGRLNVLCYLVGPALYKSLLDTKPEELEQIFVANVFGFFSIVSLVKNHLVRHAHGRIVAFTASGSEHISAKKMLPAYFSAKTALLSLVRSMAVEFAPYGITVNAIAPGWISQRQQGKTDITSRIPSRRLGKTSDLINVLAFIISPESDYCTGNNILVSGGYSV